MKILRSILGIVVGWFVSGVVIAAVQAINFFLYKPAETGGDTAKMTAWMKAVTEDPEKLAAWVKTLPFEAFLLVLISWQLGAFVGGWLSAKIAGRARLLHAGIIGLLVLAGTIYNFYDLKTRHDITHPEWMVIAGLLLPLPVSLLAGQLVAWRNPPSTLPPVTSNP
jgi:hypothetical protein